MRLTWSSGLGNSTNKRFPGPTARSYDPQTPVSEDALSDIEDAIGRTRDYLEHLRVDPNEPDPADGGPGIIDPNCQAHPLRVVFVEAIPSSNDLRTPAGTDPVRRLGSQGVPANSPARVVRCWPARSSVGAMTAA